MLILPERRSIDLRIIETVADPPAPGTDPAVPITELNGHFNDILLVTEMTSEYPEIKVFADVDLKKLTAGDSNPVFSTLPIGMANVTSGNRRHYTDAFITEMDRQIIAKKPVGIMGHLTKEERPYAFPTEAVFWIGTRRVQELLWGKGYFPPGPGRERLLRYEATNKRIATSIDADCDSKYDNGKEAFVMIPSTLKLKQIDIAPEDRAGIPSLSAVPMITQEMLSDNRKFYVPEIPKEKEMGKEETIREMTAADASLLPQSVTSAVKAEAIQEFRQSLGLPDGTDMSAYFKSIQTAAETAEKTKITSRITEMAGDTNTGIKVPLVKNLVISMINKLDPKTVQEAEGYYKEVVESKEITELLAGAVQETMGPSQATQMSGQSTQAKPGKYFK